MEVELTVKRNFDVHYLKVDVGVHNWGGGDVNGKEDIDFDETKGEGVPSIPCAVKVKDKPKSKNYSDHYRWQPIINLNSGQIINWTQGISAHVYYIIDDGEYTLLDKDNNEIISVQSYVPYFLNPGEDPYADFMTMEIDENGFIKNWQCDSEAIEYLVNHTFEIIN